MPRHRPQRTGSSRGWAPDRHRAMTTRRCSRLACSGRPLLADRARPGRPRGDDGTVLVLTLGLAMLLLVLVGVVVDVSVTVLAKRSVASAADGAAVSAAQALDYEVFYAQGLAGGVPLSDDAVAERVAGYEAVAAREQPGLRLSGHVEGGGTAVVTGTRTVALPFSGWIGDGTVQVSAEARARAPLAP